MQYSNNIYCNFNIKSEDTKIPGEYNFSKNTPIVEKPSCYYLKLVSATIPLDNVPYMLIKDNTMSVTINSSTSYLKNISLYPPQPFYVYYIHQFTSIVNNAFKEATDNENTKSNLNLEPPILIFNFEINRFQLIIPSIFCIDNHKIFINEALFRVIPGFYNSYINPLYQILVYHNGNNFFPNGISNTINYPVLVMNYENKGADNLQNVNRIRIIIESYIENREYVINSNDTDPNDINLQSILAEIPISKNKNMSDYSDTQIISNLVYSNLNNPLKNLCIKIKLVDHNGNILPYDIPRGSSVNLKLQFIHKIDS